MYLPNNMIWASENFCITDQRTIDYVKNKDLPFLYSEINELKSFTNYQIELEPLINDLQKIINNYEQRLNMVS